MRNFRWVLSVTGIFIAVIIIIIVSPMIIKNNNLQEQLELEQQNERIDDMNAKKIQLQVDSSFVYKDNEAEKVIVERDAFIDNAEIQYRNNFRPSSLTYHFDEEVMNRIILVRFVAHNINASSRLKFVSESNPFAYDLYITKEKNVFSIPIVVSNEPMSDLSLIIEEGDVQLVLSDFEIVEWNTELKSLKAGVFPFDDIVSLTVSPILKKEELIDKNDSYLVEIRNEYLYELTPNRLNIYNKDPGGSLTRYGTVIGLGSVRDLEFLNDDYVIVVSRGNGTFIIDITNKQRPHIISHINPTGLVSGLAVTDNILFLANRYSGIEVYDLTNPLVPIFLTFIGEGEGNENIDCDVYENHLYISCWAQNIVEVWNVSNLNEPIHVSTINVPGHPYGIVANEKGLFVATGQHASTGTKTMDNYNYGTGNGLVIIDISKPSEPKWASTFKGFGRYYTNGHDNWSVKISNNVAYYCNAFAGLFIIDVTDITNPFLLDHVIAPVNPEIDDYEVFKERFTDDYQLFANEQAISPNEAVSAVAIGNGQIFTANQSNRIGFLSYERAVLNVETNDTSIIDYDIDILKKNRQMDASETYTSYLNNYSVNDIVFYNNEYFVATEANGILRLNESFELFNSFKTPSEVKDIHIQNGYLAAAYGNEGVELFTILPEGIESKALIASDIRLFEYLNNVLFFNNAKMLLVQAGFGRVKVFNTEVIESPVLMDTLLPGSLYSDNIFSNTEGDLVGFFGAKNIGFFKTSSDSSYVKNEFVNPLYSESSRPTFNKDFLYFGNSGGLFRINKNSLEELNETELSVTKIDGINYFSAGKLFSTDDFIISCNTYKNIISILRIHENADGNASYSLVEEIHTKTSPSRVEFTSRYIIVTCLKGGILVFDKESLNEKQSLNEEQSLNE